MKRKKFRKTSRKKRLSSIGKRLRSRIYRRSTGIDTLETGSKIKFGTERATN
jgi:hypothetical protein